MSDRYTLGFCCRGEALVELVLDDVLTARAIAKALLASPDFYSIKLTRTVETEVPVHV